tara:strand:- start:288 stop:626 length:339 start_codon:yes stop_codon:yes gene_type:complete
MILTDNKSIANLIGLDIIAEIADDYTFETAEFNAKYPVADRLQEAWVEAVEDQLDSYQIAQFLGRIEWDAIAQDAINAAEERRDAEAEAQEYYDNPDNWIYDKETGVWDERY